MLRCCYSARPIRKIGQHRPLVDDNFFCIFLVVRFQTVSATTLVRSIGVTASVVTNDFFSILAIVKYRHNIRHRVQFLQ